MSNEIMTVDDIQKILGQVALSQKVSGEQMGIVISELKEMKAENREREVKINERFSEIENRMGSYENNVTIDYWQVQRIKDAKDEAVNRNLKELLDLKYDSNGNLTPESYKRRKKYRRFYPQFDRDCRKKTHMRRPISETLARDYREVIEYAQTWEPEFKYKGYTGALALKLYIDDTTD